MLTDEAIQRLSARVGTTLRGKYPLERVLGWGGMAAVYAATHRNGTRVAVKLLHPELAVVEHVCRRFLREGVVANAIDHPALVRILDDDIDDIGVAFLVLELLEGETLEQRRARSGGRLSPSECLPIVDVVLDALGAAHDKGFVHRDIKPENVFLTNGGATKLMDFGVVRARDGSGATPERHRHGPGPSRAHGRQARAGPRTSTACSSCL